MKTTKAFLAILFIHLSLNVVAQSKIWLTGYVYSVEVGKQTPVPFATISIYDYYNSNELKYFTVCGPHGNYNIKPYDHTRKYYFVIEAPGYKTKTINLKEIPEIWDGKPFSGNCNVYIPLEKDEETFSEIVTKSYTKDELRKKGKAQTITDLLLLMPEIRREGNDWVATGYQREGSVCFFLNGIKATPKTLSKFDKVPADGVASINYYSLPQGGIFYAAVNVTLIVGKPATAPSEKLEPSRFFF